MSKDPWTDPDPQPGDFDEFLASIDPRDPRYVEVHEGNPDVRLTVLPAGMDADDARRLAELAARRGRSMGEVLAELVRNA
jgi:hypothetical protein